MKVKKIYGYTVGIDPYNRYRYTIRLFAVPAYFSIVPSAHAENKPGTPQKCVWQGRIKKLWAVALALSRSKHSRNWNFFWITVYRIYKFFKNFQTLRRPRARIKRRDSAAAKNLAVMRLKRFCGGWQWWGINWYINFEHRRGWVPKFWVSQIILKKF